MGKKRIRKLPWERRARESAEAYAAFLAYRDLGAGRTLAGVRKRLRKPEGYLRPIERWSAQQRWRDRANAWDAHLQGERDRAAAEQAGKWERRRLESLEEGWGLVRVLKAKLEAMLEFPLAREVVERDEAGRETRVVEPVRWSYATVAALAGRVVEIERAILLDAMPPQDDDFDPKTATDEELRAIIARHARRSLPPPH